MGPMKRKPPLFAVVLAAITLVLLPWSPAVGLDRSDMPIEVSESKPEMSRDYPVIAVFDPGPVFGTPDDCKTVPTCDYIPLVLKQSPDLLYRLVLTLSFEQAGGGNDFDMYIFQGACGPDPDSGEEVCDWEQIGSGASQSMPEVAKFADLEPSSKKNVYAIVINDFTGSSPYNIKAQLFPAKLGSLDFESDTVKPRPRQIETKSPSLKPNAGGALPVEPDSAGEETALKVKVPGPDGELTDMPLVAIKGQATPQKAPNRTPLVVLAVAVVVLGASTFVFFKIRGRNAGEEVT